MNFIGDINWLAAAGAVVAYYVLGGLWFTPFFGRAWDRSIGFDRSGNGGRFALSYYFVPLVGAVVAGLIVTVFVALTGADGIFGGAAVGAGIGMAIAAATLTNSLTPHTPRPYLFAAVTGSYHLVACTLAGAILGTFP